MRLALDHFSICGTKVMACRCGAYAVFRAVGPDGQVCTRARVIRISIRAGWRRFPPSTPGSWLHERIVKPDLGNEEQGKLSDRSAYQREHQSLRPEHATPRRVSEHPVALVAIHLQCGRDPRISQRVFGHD